MSGQSMPRAAGTTTNNLILASSLALLSYVPFEIVAKGSLILCGLLFVIDPIPPLTRVLSITSLLIIFGLTKLHRHYQQQAATEEDDEVVIIVTGEEDKEDGGSKQKKKKEE